MYALDSKTSSQAARLLLFQPALIDTVDIDEITPSEAALLIINNKWLIDKLSDKDFSQADLVSMLFIHPDLVWDEKNEIRGIFSDLSDTSFNMVTRRHPELASQLPKRK